MRARILVILLLALEGMVPTMVAAAGAPAPPLGSAIGSQFVFTITVSPDYSRTGFVVASTSAHGCRTGCERFWTTRDGGWSWRQRRAVGWRLSDVLAMTVDAAGHETLVTGEGQRSSDDGDTWHDLGPKGFPSPLPGTKGAVVVASGQSDAIVDPDGNVRPVKGSADAMSDLDFAPSPDFPSGGRFAPALLGGVDLKSGLAIVERCSADFTCGDVVSLPRTGSASQPAGMVWMSLSSAWGKDGTVFVHTTTRAFLSHDGGATFTDITGRLGAPSATATGVTALAPQPGYAESGPVHTVISGVTQVFMNGGFHSGGYLRRSTDGGATWFEVGSPRAIGGMVQAAAIAPDGRIFAGYSDPMTLEGGLVCIDAKTWQIACKPVGQPAAVRSGGPGVSPPTVCVVGSCGGSVPTPPTAGPPDGAASVPISATQAAAPGTRPRSAGSILVPAIMGLALAACAGAIIAFRAGRRRLGGGRGARRE